MSTTAELEQDMEEAIIEGRRKKKVERRVREIFVENDRRRVDRRAVDRRSPREERRMSGRRNTDPDVDEMVERLKQQQHKKSEKSDSYINVVAFLSFLSGIILSQITNFYMEKNILELLLTFLTDLL
jgi:hypothetical protein